jgi:hypothetical protein
VEKPQCQTLKSRVRNATHRLNSLNANRSITGSVTLLIRNVASPAATHGAQTSVAREEQEASVSDLKSPAINAARLTLFRLSRQRAGQYCAAIVLVQIARRNKEPEFVVVQLSEPPASALTKLLPGEAVGRGPYLTRLTEKTALKYAV